MTKLTDKERAALRAELLAEAEARAKADERRDVRRGDPTTRQAAPILKRVEAERAEREATRGKLDTAIDKAADYLLGRDL